MRTNLSKARSLPALMGAVGGFVVGLDVNLICIHILSARLRLGFYPTAFLDMLITFLLLTTGLTMIVNNIWLKESPSISVFWDALWLTTIVFTLVPVLLPGFAVVSFIRERHAGMKKADLKGILPTVNQLYAEMFTLRHRTT